jgi:hypothetical protein
MESRSLPSDNLPNLQCKAVFSAMTVFFATMCETLCKGMHHTQPLNQAQYLYPSLQVSSLRKCPERKSATYRFFNLSASFFVRPAPGSRSNALETVAPMTHSHTLAVYWAQQRCGKRGFHAPPQCCCCSVPRLVPTRAHTRFSQHNKRIKW